MLFVICTIEYKDQLYGELDADSQDMTTLCIGRFRN